MTYEVIAKGAYVVIVLVVVACLASASAKCSTRLQQ